MRLVVGALVLALALGAVVAERTVLMETALQAWLKSQGIGNVTLRVTGLDWRKIQVEGIRFGDELFLDALKVSYDVGQLISAQVSSIEITGLELTVSDFNSDLMAVVRQNLAASQSAEAGPSITLPRILLRDGKVHLSQADNSIRAKISGELHPDGSGTLRVSSGHVMVPGLAPFDISGQALFDGAHGKAELVASPDKSFPPIIIKATFDGNEGSSGGAAFEVSKLSFASGGLQPGHWLLALKDLGPVSGDFEGSGEVTLSPAGPTWVARVRFSGAGVREDDFNVIDGAGVVTIEPGAGQSGLALQVQDGQAVVGTRQGQRVRLNDLNIHADLDFETLNLNARLETLTVKHPWIEPLHFTGDGERNGDLVNFSIQAQDNLLSATGHHDLATQKGMGTVHAGPWRFTPHGLQPKQLSPLFADIEEARGTLGATLKAHWGGEADGTASIILDDLTLKTNSLVVEGLNANLNFAHLTTPVMERVQTVQAQRIGGVLDLVKPSIAFRFAPEDKLYIAHAESGVAGGQMKIDDQTIDFRKSNHPITVVFSRLDLESLFGLLNVDGVSGTGVLSGSIPLMISADAVTVANGRFAATGPGVLQMRSQAARNALGGAGQDAVMLLDVLDDFHYQSLELSIDREAGGEARILLSTAGSNPAVMDDQPFVLNVSVSTQLDKVLAVLSTALSLSQKALRGTLKSLQ
ncbi:intermembrane phospholipid transport protein YdbH family protein [Magnetovibrio blakemorei]|nr:YdbH domain-containing protein [Magnetovibrio blakemorei]